MKGDVNEFTWDDGQNRDKDLELFPCLCFCVIHSCIREATVTPCTNS